MKIVFSGTPGFAAVHLRALLGAGYDVVAVYSQPDRRSGRGRKLKEGPVKALALDAGLTVLQPRDLRERRVQEQLAAYQADLMVVVAYGSLLPKVVLGIPRLGCINVHASLLPRWRGAAPIQRAILAGDEQTGVSIMRMDEGLDTGPVYGMARCPVEAADAAQPQKGLTRGVSRSKMA